MGPTLSTTSIDGSNFSKRNLGLRRRTKKVPTAVRTVTIAATNSMIAEIPMVEVIASEVEAELVGTQNPQYGLRRGAPSRYLRSHVAK